jgi:hypothetical protein
VLDKANLDKAARIIVLSPKRPSGDQFKDNQTLMVTIAAAVRPRDTSIPTVVEIIDERSLQYEHILENVEYINGRDFCERLTSQAVLNPGATEIYSALLHLSTDRNGIFITPVPGNLVGKAFNQARLHFLENDEEDIVPIGIERKEGQGTNAKAVFYPGAAENTGDQDLVLRSDDKLVVMACERPSYALVDEKGKWSPTYLATK